MPIPKIKGIPFDFAGEVLVIPPLALGDLQRLSERIAAFTGELNPTTVGTVIEAGHAALRRNYPDLTIEHVGEIIDVGNFLEVFAAVMDISGVKRKAGEAPVGEALAPSIGASSTPD